MTRLHPIAIALLLVCGPLCAEGGFRPLTMAACECLSVDAADPTVRITPVSAASDSIIAYDPDGTLSWHGKILRGGDWRVEFAFDGTGVALVRNVGPDAGTISATVDALPPVQIGGKDPDSATGRLVWLAQGLAPGTHTVILQGGGGPVSLCGFVVMRPTTEGGQGGAAKAVKAGDRLIERQDLLRGIAVRTLAADAGLIWLGTENTGFGRLDVPSGRLAMLLPIWQTIESPPIIGAWWGDIRRVLVSGERVWFACRGGVVRYEKPHEAWSRVEVPGEARDLAVLGDRLLVASTRGLFVLNDSGEITPTSVRRPLTAVFVRGKSAWIGDDSGRIQQCDLADFATRDTYDTGLSYVSGFAAFDRAFMAFGASGRGQPACVLGEWGDVLDLPWPHATRTMPFGLARAVTELPGGKACVSGYGGLAVYDRALSAPVLALSPRRGIPHPMVDGALAVLTAGAESRLWVAHGAGLSAFRMSDLPASPMPLLLSGNTGYADCDRADIGCTYEVAGSPDSPGAGAAAPRQPVLLDGETGQAAGIVEIAGPGHDLSVTFAFGALATLSRVLVHSPMAAPTATRIEVSTDGVAYQPADRFTLQPGWAQGKALETKGRYVRLVIESGAGRCGVDEVELWGRKAEDR